MNRYIPLVFLIVSLTFHWTWTKWNKNGYKCHVYWAKTNILLSFPKFYWFNFKETKQILSILVLQHFWCLLTPANFWIVAEARREVEKWGWGLSWDWGRRQRERRPGSKGQQCENKLELYADKGRKLWKRPKMN